MDLKIPLDIHAGRMFRTQSEDEAIRQHLTMLITTPVGECILDPKFGFVFNNLRFEIFDENNGTVLAPETVEEEDDYLYHEKLSGTSKNINTFASELKNAIEHYEHRLKDVRVTMTYTRLEQRIYISIKAIKVSTETEFEFSTHINTWK